MFRKQPEPPPTPPYLLEVLTTEYRIKGTMKSELDLIVPVAKQSWRELWLSKLEIQPLNQPLTVQTTEKYALTGQSNIILLPHAPLEHIHNHIYWELFKISRPGLYHLGPYVILGKLMFINLDQIADTMPMTDVTISHTNPDLKFPEISAPFILINTHWLSGYIPM